MSQYGIGVELLFAKKEDLFPQYVVAADCVWEYTVLEWHEINKQINLKPQGHNFFHYLYLICFSSYQVILEINLRMD
jgi:hypothetical protein